MRLLLIGDLDEHRLLVRKHVEIEWPDASIIEHRPGRDVPLEEHFAAIGFDCVVIVGAGSSAEACESLAMERLAQPEFAPIVLLLLQDPPPEPPPGVRRLRRLYGRKIDHDRLVAGLVHASQEHHDELAALRSIPDHAQRHRFGSIVIRGHRCLKQIGSGGMCNIFLAESERSGTVVVLKVFHQVPDVSERVANFDRFLQEYHIVAGLEHRHIVRIFDLGVADDHAYIAMEHFPAGNLRRRMTEPLAPATALEFLGQMASALDAVHRVGVLHRDLKPENVMLRADGTLCLIDFGLAKVNGLGAGITGTREIFGTPYYMSPEQGHAELVDARSDLYSLGVIFYEMLAGHKPFTGTNAMQVIYKHKRTPLPALALGPELAGYEEMAQRLLAKAPGDRYPSAGALLEAIANLKAGAGTNLSA